jgi:membrane-associated protease RseP (regulator of RpoE activity)
MTPQTAQAGTWSRLLWVLLFVIPVIVLFLAPAAAPLATGVWFWLALLVCFWLIATMAGMPTADADRGEDIGPRMIAETEQPDVIKEIMSVNVATEGGGGIRVFRGRLRVSAASAYERLRGAFSGQSMPLLRQDDEMDAAVVVMPAPEAQAVEQPIKPWAHWLLFGLTIVTTTWAGAAHQGVNLLTEPERFGVGLPYSLGLLAILGVHELGHYFMARRHGIRVTPPYFIPVPMALGTFGAFIQMRSPVQDRRALFDVAVAGPLAGLAVAVPALLIGLQSSTVIADTTPAQGMLGGSSVGSSVLFALLAKLSLGPTLEYGHLLRLSPLAFAGWLGLLVTALNLLPIGQLDGGHMSSAMFGRRTSGAIGSIAMWTLVLLAIFVWPGLTMWAILVFFIAGNSVPPLNDLTPITPGRQWVGYATFGILALILAPLPHALWSAAGLHCPYL